MTTDLQVTALTFALVHEETAGSSEVDGVVDPEALQILTHLPSLREFRINIFEINLRRERGTRSEKKSEPFLINEATFLYLHHQIHKAFVVVAGHRRVRTHHQLSVNFCGQINMLSCRGRRVSDVSSFNINETLHLNHQIAPLIYRYLKIN